MNRVDEALRNFDQVELVLSLLKQTGYINTLYK